MAREAGLSALEATLMSAFVYSGTAQAATIGAFAHGAAQASLAASVVTVLMLNARYLLYGASLRPWLGQVGPGQAYGSLYFLGDASWVMATQAHAQGENDAGFIFGSGIAMFLPWIGGTLLGAAIGGWIADPRTLGVDFLLVAFCAAMGLGLFKGKADLWPAGAGILVAALLDRFAPSGWTIVAAGIAGAAVAGLRFKGEA